MGEDFGGVGGGMGLLLPYIGPWTRRDNGVNSSYTRNDGG